MHVMGLGPHVSSTVGWTTTRWKTRAGELLRWRAAAFVTMMSQKVFRIIILGAGFSKAAGLPLAGELWREIRKRARRLHGRAEQFDTDLRAYIDFRRDCDGVELTPEQVDFEDFLRFLDIEHYLGFRGSDTWSEDGNEGQIVVKTLIGEILVEHTPSVADMPELYLRFADKLQPDDIVLTFNYDILLERALQAVGKPYRLFPDRYESVHHDGGGIVDSTRQEVLVLKLHGSIDWFSRAEYAEREEQYRRVRPSSRPEHLIFTHVDELEVTKLLEGPRPPDEPLNQIYRVGRVEELYKKDIMFYATPWLLAPSTMKIVYSGKLKDFWWGLGSGGVLNFGLAIVGYSLPHQDDYARQAIYSLVTNYQTEYWGKDVGEFRKSPLVIVDRRQGEEGSKWFDDRYGFVDRSRATLYFDSLDEKAVDLIFAEG